MGHGADTGIPGKQDYSKFQSWIMALGFKGYGQSPEDGAKPLVYACCAPEEDLRGTLCSIWWYQLLRDNISCVVVTTFCAACSINLTRGSALFSWITDYCSWITDYC